MAQSRETGNPKFRVRGREKPRVETCLNCAAAIHTRYCPHCGQENATADLTLGAVLREFFAEVFYYDSKLWRTLRMLLFHPGRLSIDWSSGRRTRYISPIRLYLSITFLFFVAASWRGGSGLQIQTNLSPTDQSEFIRLISKPETTEFERTQLTNILNRSKLSSRMQGKLDAALAQVARRSLNSAALASEGLSNMSAKDQAELLKVISKPQTTDEERAALVEVLKTSKLSPEIQAKLDAAQASLGEKPNTEPALPPQRAQADESGMGSIERRTGWLGRQINKIEAAAKADPGGLQRRYVDQIPKVLFIVLPLFAIALKVLYSRQKRFFVEHLVFILHLHSFAFLALLPTELVRSDWGPGIVVRSLLIVWMPIYGFIAMLRFYRQPWWLTGMKAGFLGVVYLLLVAAGALLALVFTVTSMPDVPGPPPAGGVRRNAPPAPRPATNAPRVSPTPAAKN